MNISNCIADVVTNAFPIGNATVKGILVCMVAGSFAASLQLTNDRMVPVSSIVGTENPWALIDNYNKPYCILTLLNCGSSTFPAYLLSASYISVPASS